VHVFFCVTPNAECTLYILKGVSCSAEKNPAQPAPSGVREFNLHAYFPNGSAARDWKFVVDNPRAARFRSRINHTPTPKDRPVDSQAAVRRRKSRILISFIFARTSGGKTFREIVVCKNAATREIHFDSETEYGRRLSLRSI